MADYYSILKKTIDGLPRNTPELRNAVYQKARTAIANQLRGMNPPPAEEAVSAQLQLLEDAILVVDMEYHGGSAQPAPEPAAPSPDPAPVPAPAAPDPAPAPVETAPPPAPPTATVQQPESEPVPAPQPAAPPPAPESPVITSPEPVAAPVSPAPTVGGHSEPPTVGMVPPPQPSVPGGAASPQAVPAEPAPVVGAPVANTAEQPDPFQPRRKTGLVKKLVVPLLILAVLAGGAYALWINRDALQPIVSALFSSSETEETTAGDGGGTSLSSEDQAIEQDIAAQSDKESVKLGADGSETEVSATDDNVRLVEPEDPVQEADTDGSQDSSNQVVEQDDSANEQQALLGEVAYLYEEGSAGTGATRTNAAISWETKQDVLSDGLAAEPVIVGRMIVPEKDLTVDIEIKRNVDEALSASHIIEVRFDVPEGFAGSNIDNIARFVMKSSEEARGEPLVAVPVKVSDGFFLIALDNLQQAVTVNTRLMLESSWIDIPISYATGKRALITLEKGGTGERIFQDTIKDWQNR